MATYALSPRSYWASVRVYWEPGIELLTAGNKIIELVDPSFNYSPVDIRTDGLGNVRLYRNGVAASVDRALALFTSYRVEMRAYTYPNAARVRYAIYEGDSTTALYTAYVSGSMGGNDFSRFGWETFNTYSTTTDHAYLSGSTDPGWIGPLPPEEGETHTTTAALSAAAGLVANPSGLVADSSALAGSADLVASAAVVRRSTAVLAGSVGHSETTHVHVEDGEHVDFAAAFTSSAVLAASATVVRPVEAILAVESAVGVVAGLTQLVAAEAVLAASGGLSVDVHVHDGSGVDMDGFVTGRDAAEVTTPRPTTTPQPGVTVPDLHTATEQPAAGVTPF